MRVGMESIFLCLVNVPQEVRDLYEKICMKRSKSSRASCSILPVSDARHLWSLTPACVQKYPLALFGNIYRFWLTSNVPILLQDLYASRGLFLPILFSLKASASDTIRQIKMDYFQSCIYSDELQRYST